MIILPFWMADIDARYIILRIYLIFGIGAIIYFWVCIAPQIIQYLK